MTFKEKLQTTRRKFLKKVGLAAGGIALLPHVPGFSQSKPYPDIPDDAVISGDALANFKKLRSIELTTQPEGPAPQEFAMSALAANTMKAELGIDVVLRPMPFSQQATVVWEEDNFDMAAWRMVGRPERSDPDELIFNLFHPSTWPDGFNFTCFNNDEYTKVVEAQRRETDPDKRRELVFKSQEIIAEEQPYRFVVNPKSVSAFNNTVWDADSIVNARGIGIRNFFTFLDAKPVSNQRNMIFSALVDANAVNPLFVSGDLDSRLTEVIWDRLMRIGPDGLPQLWAAESVEFSDSTTLDITIREGMKWHDGQPVTSGDVAFSIDAIKTGEAPTYSPFVKAVTEIEIVDDRSLRIKLNAPSASIRTSMLSKINLIPKHIWEPILNDLANKPENAESIQEEVPIGSGPFRFLERRPGEQTIMERNPDHFAASRIQIDKLVARVIPNVEATLGALQTGEINLIGEFGGDPDVLKRIAQSNPDVSVVTTTVFGFRFFAYYQMHQPFNDKVFRQAVSLAISREDIKDLVFKGEAEIADAVVSKALEFWHNPNLEQFAFNPVRARKLLADNGWKWDQDGNLYLPEGRSNDPVVLGGPGAGA